MKRSEYIEILSCASHHIPPLPLRQTSMDTWEPGSPADTARHVLAYVEALHEEIERRRDDKEPARAARPPEEPPAAPFGWWAMHPRRRAVFLDWLSKQEPHVEDEAPFTAVRDAACDLLSGLLWVRNERGEVVRYEVTFPPADDVPEGLRRNAPGDIEEIYR